MFIVGLIMIFFIVVLFSWNTCESEKCTFMYSKLFTTHTRMYILCCSFLWKNNTDVFCCTNKFNVL